MLMSGTTPDRTWPMAMWSARPSRRAGSPRWISPRPKPQPGVIAIVTWQNAGQLGKAKNNHNVGKLLGGPDIEHYDQAIALVVAETFEQARAAAKLIRVDYVREKGRFDLADQIASAPPTGGDSGEGSAAPPMHRVGDFEGAFAAAPVKIDQTYTTPDQSHAMMEPHATIAAWQGDALTLVDLHPDDRLGSARHQRDAAAPPGEGPRHLALTSAAGSARSCGSAATR